MDVLFLNLQKNKSTSGIPREIIALSGGLGNQMFQYSFFLARKRYNKDTALVDYLFRFEPNPPHNGCELPYLFDIPVYENIFVRNIVWLARKLLIFQSKRGFQSISSLIFFILKRMKINIIDEKKGISPNYEGIINHTGFCLYMGNWLSKKYFSPIRGDIFNSFSFQNLNKSCKTSEILNIIEKTNSISIHIRRGDFLLEEEKFGNICTLQYYEKAIAEMKKHVESPVFFMFSNDMKWVRENMDTLNPYYIDWNHGKDSWQDMFLMSKCKHNIIANSTFSWWGAWLNQSPQKIVITPSRFLNSMELPDLLPETWIKI